MLQWSTVGSSNLDPLSLSLNLEANVIVRDRAFNQILWDRLDALMQHNCKQVQAADLTDWSAWRLVRSFFVFHLLRWYPAWAGWLPRHVPRWTPLEDDPGRAALARRGRTRRDDRHAGNRRRRALTSRSAGRLAPREANRRMGLLRAGRLSGRATGTHHRLAQRARVGARDPATDAPRGGGIRRLQPRALQHLRPARPPE